MNKNCPHCKRNIEYDKPQQLGGHITNCKENPRRVDIIKKSNKTKHNNLYEKYDITCLYCKKEYILELSENQYKGGRYTKCCSKKCSHKYSISFIDHDKLKKSKCNKCGNVVNIKLNDSHSNTLCDSCTGVSNINKSYKKKFLKIKNGKIKNFKIVNGVIVCSICGQQKCKDKTCKTWISGRSKVFIKIGFDINKLGSDIFYDEYNRIIELLKHEYLNMSLVEIGEKYDINFQTIQTIFKKLGIKTRNNSDSGLLAIKKGRKTISEVPIYPYKSGHHISWEGKVFWYRSSYELDYCKFLDDNKIKYDVEKLRFQYYDTIKKHNRTAIPDFYLSDTNEIVEIKSNWTYDEKNMKDKVIAYKNAGYKVILVLEHKEIKM